ncbi:HepT-like ribonuclease domain-containing protein [Sporichthya polymorpha]|uniref:HepT-like ribonuclease domain-containing protein n=1 Tax=Sporichthya polymorpha TaxID=35751 RepID=UPI0003A05342|nr:HepT-like ribonuclease domain-containing protein [Sporichthya polymorpha]
MRDWLDRAQMIVEGGRAAYDADELRQEAGDSLMMKLGEAANRLDRANIASPEGVRWRDAVANRNWLIHQYDHIDRDITWATLETDLLAWREALASTFASADAYSAAERDERQLADRPEGGSPAKSPRAGRATFRAGLSVSRTAMRWR